MYHCHIHFYFMGQPCRVFEMIKEMPALEHFSHEFLESKRPEGALTAKADVIVADLQDMDVKQGVRALITGKSKEAQLILLADQSQIALLKMIYPRLMIYGFILCQIKKFVFDSYDGSRILR